FCLAAIVAISLVLPLYAGAGVGRGAFDRRTALRWVWTCQLAGTFAGLMVIAAPFPPIVGLVMATVVCATCLAALRRRQIA
ncbi:MAG: hypothetical protein M3552_05570, partial [Planctomycetota bacterium]|nr:hypothetical protein [Planctomycetota bacterium]